MAVTINSNGTITGIAAGGLPDGVVDTDTLAADAVTAAKVANNAVDSAELVAGSVDLAHLSATGTAGSGNFLRGDGSWQTAGSTSASDLSSGTLPMARLSGTLPALNGSSLTNLPIQCEEDYWSLAMNSATGTTVHSITASFTPKLAWMTYNPNGASIGLVTGWMNVSGGTAGSQNVNNGGQGTNGAGKFWQGNGMFQCVCAGGAQYVDMTASASGQYTITNTHPGGSLSGTGYFSLILFGN